MKKRAVHTRKPSVRLSKPARAVTPSAANAAQAVSAKRRSQPAIGRRGYYAPAAAATRSVKAAGWRGSKIDRGEVGPLSPGPSPLLLVSQAMDGEVRDRNPSCK